MEDNKKYPLDVNGKLISKDMVQKAAKKCRKDSKGLDYATFMIKELKPMYPNSQEFMQLVADAIITPSFIENCIVSDHEIE